MKIKFSLGNELAKDLQDYKNKTGIPYATIGRMALRAFLSKDKTTQQVQVEQVAKKAKSNEEKEIDDIKIQFPKAEVRFDYTLKKVFVKNGTVNWSYPFPWK
jgi:hypothetical protein